MKTKTELAKLVLTDEEYAKTDIALPQTFVNEMKEQRVDARQFYVWCYKNSVFGEPINLAERFYLYEILKRKKYD